MDDEEIRERLRELDEDEDVVMNSWEAEFIESVCYSTYDGPLSERQRSKAEEILQDYDYT